MKLDNQEMMQEVLAGIDEIPPMPQVVLQAQKLLANPDSSAKELAELLETDASIAAKVLKMANSAFYGLRGKVSSIQHASMVLGFRNLGEIVSVAGVQKSLEKNCRGMVWSPKIYGGTLFRLRWVQKLSLQGKIRSWKWSRTPQVSSTMSASSSLTHLFWKRKKPLIPLLKVNKKHF